jgi:hypothetical protein
VTLGLCLPSSEGFPEETLRSSFIGWCVAAHIRRRLLRGHAEGAIQADGLAVSMGLSRIWRTSKAYSSGRPRRFGNGTLSPSERWTFSGRPSNIGVSEIPNTGLLENPAQVTRGGLNAGCPIRHLSASEGRLSVSRECRAGRVFLITTAPDSLRRSNKLWRCRFQSS